MAMSNSETSSGSIYTNGIDFTNSSNAAITKPEAGPITKVTTKHYLPAAATLAEAFEHDDVARYVIDMPECDHWSREKKWKLHCSIMNYITYAHCMRGLTTATGPPADPFGSVALWMTPNRSIESLPVILSSGLWRLNYKLSPAGRKRFFRDFLPTLDKTKLDVLGPRANQCYYLVYIGTKAACRGMGLAKKLIEDVSAAADREGRCMYLESSAERNLKLYRRLGFEVRKRIWLKAPNQAGKQIPLDIMVREPGGLLTMAAVDSGISMSPQTTQERVEEDKTVWGKYGDLPKPAKV